MSPFTISLKAQIARESARGIIKARLEQALKRLERGDRRNCKVLVEGILGKTIVYPEKHGHRSFAVVFLESDEGIDVHEILFGNPK